jgi:hypothetical protein
MTEPELYTRIRELEEENAKLRTALEEYAKEENWFECDDDNTGDPKTKFLLYSTDKKEFLAGCEIAQAALTPRQPEEGKE